MITDNKYWIINISIKIIICLFVVTTCKKNDEFQKIRDGNFDIVAKGTYRGKPTFPNQENGYEHIVEVCRGNIENNADILQLITKKFFFGQGNFRYVFKFAAIDKEENCLILRYFTRILNHRLYAGYQIQFVFDINSKDLKGIFTAEVPLE